MRHSGQVTSNVWQVCTDFKKVADARLRFRVSTEFAVGSGLKYTLTRPQTIVAGGLPHLIATYACKSDCESPVNQAATMLRNSNDRVDAAFPSSLDGATRVL